MTTVQYSVRSYVLLPAQVNAKASRAVGWAPQAYLLVLPSMYGICWTCSVGRSYKQAASTLSLIPARTCSMDWV